MSSICPHCQRLGAAGAAGRLAGVRAAGPGLCPQCSEALIDDLNDMLDGLGAALDAPTATLPSEERRARSAVA